MLISKNVKCNLLNIKSMFYFCFFCSLPFSCPVSPTYLSFNTIQGVRIPTWNLIRSDGAVLTYELCELRRVESCWSKSVRSLLVRYQFKIATRAKCHKIVNIFITHLPSPYNTKYTIFSNNVGKMLISLENSLASFFLSEKFFILK